MTSRSIIVLLLAAVLAAAAAGCGGNSEPSLSSESRAAVDELERICDEAAAEAQEAQDEFPVEDFDPENPNPADLPAVGNYFSTGHAVWDDALEEARGLTVPRETEAQVDALLDAVESDLTLAKQQAQAAKDADVTGFTATLDDVDASRAVVDAAADELGADCAY